MGKVRSGKSFWMLLGLLVLGLPLRWLVAAAISIGFHELCHYIMVRMCGGEVYSLHITAGGVKMHTSALTPAKQLLCALAGPLGGLILFLASIKMPRLALCALAHSVLNLAPIYPMDGGQALQSLTELLFPVYGPRIFLWLQRGLMGALILGCVWASLVCDLGILPLVLAAFLLAKSDFLNNPCKDG